MRASHTLPRSRVVGVGAQTIALDVKAPDRDNEANLATCAFLRSVLGGAAVTCEVVHGHKAPLKTLRVLGVASADAAHHRLVLAKGFK